MNAGAAFLGPFVAGLAAEHPQPCNQASGSDVATAPRGPQGTGMHEAARPSRREARAQQTYANFIKDLCRAGRLSEDFAEQAASVVLATLERRLLRGEISDLESQLPQKLIQGLGRFAPLASLLPEKLSRDEFVQLVADQLGLQPSEAEGVIRAVFGTVRSHVSEGEIDHVLGQFPQEFADLWSRVL